MTRMMNAVVVSWYIKDRWENILWCGIDIWFSISDHLHNFAAASKNFISCASTTAKRRTSSRLFATHTSQIKATVSSSGSSRKRKVYDMLEYANPSVNNHVSRSKRVRKRCSHKGCTNLIQKGGVCCRHGAEIKRCSHEGVQIILRMEGYVSDMVQSGRLAAKRVVSTMPSKEECV